MHDTAFLDRIELLLELMQIEPDKPMKKLQWEALKYYPLYYTANIRRWMSWKTASYAADLANKREGLYDQLTQ